MCVAVRERCLHCKSTLSGAWTKKELVIVVSNNAAATYM